MSEKVASAPKVLIVSNQQTTGPLWAFSLQQQKLNVAMEAVPANTLARFEKESPDLIIMDINLPEAQTLDLIRGLRAETLTPVLLLAFARTEEFMLEAYQAGVDDFLPKPVSPSLFQAKVNVWLRRFGSTSADFLNPVRVGTLQLFPAEKMVFLRNGAAARLTNLELRLLYYLMQRTGQIVTIEELNQRVWGYNAEADNTMLKNVVYRLRRKIEADPANPLIIQTVTGIGYRLAAE
ncbi:MAG TPA: winged helix-turn-helix domain-containing protein [Anaerolineales bacterium]|nr:winged helix-turn-helix domain-containing protein [Anaerolineales bacterium]